MARIRSIHPSLFTDEAWVSCSPLARVLYIGLMTDADDQGLFEWKPLQIRMRLLAGDNADVPALLAELVSANLIAALESGGKKLGAIRKFRRFQRPKKPNAIFVLPPEWGTYVGLTDASSEPDDDEDAAVPPKAEQDEQMEDGGGRKERLEAPLPAATVVATDTLPIKPKPPKAKPDKPWLTDADFSAAWDLCTPEMRRRSLSRMDTYPHWRKQAGIAGGAPILRGALEAYLRADPDVKRTGGPGFHLWLKDGTWDHWTSEQAANAPGFNLAEFEAKRARRKAAIEAEEHAA